VITRILYDGVFHIQNSLISYILIHQLLRHIKNSDGFSHEMKIIHRDLDEMFIDVDELRFLRRLIRRMFPAHRVKFRADLDGVQIFRPKHGLVSVRERHAHLRLASVRPHVGLERARRIRRPAFRHRKLKHHFSDGFDVFVKRIE